MEHRNFVSRFAKTASASGMPFQSFSFSAMRFSIGSVLINPCACREYKIAEHFEAYFLDDFEFRIHRIYLDSPARIRPPQMAGSALATPLH